MPIKVLSANLDTAVRHAIFTFAVKKKSFFSSDSGINSRCTSKVVVGWRILHDAVRYRS